MSVDSILRTNTLTCRASLRTLELEQRQQSLVRARDVPHYSKYILTQETVQYLKNPTFDIWHWDTNEMLCLLEHMYHELGIVTELMISPIVLRRWLVSLPPLSCLCVCLCPCYLSFISLPFKTTTGTIRFTTSGIVSV